MRPGPRAQSDGVRQDRSPIPRAETSVRHAGPTSNPPLCKRRPFLLLRGVQGRGNGLFFSQLRSGRSELRPPALPRRLPIGRPRGAFPPSPPSSSSGSHGGREFLCNGVVLRNRLALGADG